MSRGEKGRIDKLLVDRGLIGTRERGKALIMAGKVMVNGARVDKPGAAVPIDAEIIVKEPPPYVGRGGIKLAGALDHFGIDVEGRVILDIGSSTGGFTDCLLQRGASKVYAIDVGKGLIDWKLRNDPRVVLLEGKNIRYLEAGEVGEDADMAVIDVSFISLEKVIPRVSQLLKGSWEIVALIKPQFEVGKGQVGKGGIVRDPAKHTMVVERIQAFAEASGMAVEGVCDSPIKGGKGNREFWIYLKGETGRVVADKSAHLS
ncbi:MAG: TlyA family RNA methyltransferase [Thermodesulfobacteriota bacterium]